MTVMEAELPVTRREPDALMMIQSVIDKGVTQENVAALRELVALKRDMDKDRAQREFTVAFLELQEQIGRIKATKIIPSRDGTMRSSFAPFEEIDAQLRPLCRMHGFAYTFAEGPFLQAKVTKVCTVMHKGGHERSNSFSVRIGSGPPGCSEAQADGAAHSYAKRGALCDAFCIVVVGIDNDARLEGDLNTKVTPEQAEELERRVSETNSNKSMFLKVAGAARFSEIPANRYADLDALLAVKEGRAK